MGRLISAGVLIQSQADFFSPITSFARIAGITSADITGKLFLDNVVVPWSIVDGTTVTDASISAGQIFFNPISSATGYYSVRFFPDKTGYWRLNLVYGTSAFSAEFDVIPAGTLGNSGSGGLNASFLP